MHDLETGFAPSPEGHVAYQVVGNGPRDLVFVPNWGSNVDVMWEEPSLARFLRRLATFDGPARAIRCASAICGGVRPLGIEIRAGLRTGECELKGDDVGGIAVHIGARVAEEAGAGEVLVSSTVKDLVAGSGIEWRLFAVEPASRSV